MKRIKYSSMFELTIAQHQCWLNTPYTIPPGNESQLQSNAECPTRTNFSPCLSSALLAPWWSNDVTALCMTSFADFMSLARDCAADRLLVWCFSRTFQLHERCLLLTDSYSQAAGLSSSITLVASIHNMARMNTFRCQTKKTQLSLRGRASASCKRQKQYEEQSKSFKPGYLCLYFWANKCYRLKQRTRISVLEELHVVCLFTVPDTMY